MRAQDPSLIAGRTVQGTAGRPARFCRRDPDRWWGWSRATISPLTPRASCISTTAGTPCWPTWVILRGYEYGYEALVDERVRPLLEQALVEARQGIVADYGVDGAWLDAHARELMHRYANRILGDTIFRLGRDPLRKLAPTDRLVGAARLAEKAGLKPDALAWGIAAGYCFDAADDPMAVEMQTRIREQGFAAVLSAVSEIQASEPLGADGARALYRAERKGPRMTTERELFPEERKHEIVRMITAEGRVSVTELSRKYGVSEVTIRTDLQDLADQGLIVRTHGGAVVVPHSPDILSLNLRRQQQTTEKERIGAAAAVFVADGDAIFLDTSSTTLAIARRLKQFRDLTVLTNSLAVTQTLLEMTGITVVMTGRAAAARHGLAHRSGRPGPAGKLQSQDRLFWRARADVRRGADRCQRG